MATQKKEVTTPQHHVFAGPSAELFIDLIFFIYALAHLRTSPFTKVEESFNLHAIHDILMYGVGSDALHNYDHFTFPGVIPRTFVGSVLLAWLAKPILWIEGWRDDREFHPKMQMQIMVRLILLAINCFALRRMRLAISKRFGSEVSATFGLLLIFQFHLPFWMSRTLPNMFALSPVTLAFSFLIDQPKRSNKPSRFNINAAIALLTATTVIFRAEILLLLIPTALQALYLRHITFTNLVLVGLVSGLASLGLTLTVDSYFWDRPYLWPEFNSIFFNVYEGKSSEWGTSPPHTYLTTHLPKLLLLSFPLSLLGLAIDKRIRTLLLPSTAFLALMSCLPHKEWRFVVYVVPMFTLGAARGEAWIVFPIRSIFRPFALMVTLLLSGAVRNTLGSLSAENYPGGKAMVLFHEVYPADYITPLGTPPHIHICNLAAQTGASLFMQFNAPPYNPPFLKPLPFSDAAPTPTPTSTSYTSYISAFISNLTHTPNTSTPFRTPTQPWIYNKTEHMSIRDLTLAKPITHLISEVGPAGNGIRGASGSGGASGSEEEMEVEKEWRLVVPVKTRSKFKWKAKSVRKALSLGWEVSKGGRGELWPWVEVERLWIYERRWEWVGESESEGV